MKLRHEIGIDIIAWECDYPHSDCFWPDAPEQVLAELNAAGADDSDINKITWENSCRYFQLGSVCAHTERTGDRKSAAPRRPTSTSPFGRARSGHASTPRSSWPRRDSEADGDTLPVRIV